MADKEYIERGALLKTYKGWLTQLENPEDEGDKRGVESCIAVLEDTPTADVVEVVRCEGCKFYEKAEYDGGTKDVCRLFKRQMQPCDYCSYGKRKYR